MRNIGPILLIGGLIGIGFLVFEYFKNQGQGQSTLSDILSLKPSTYPNPGFVWQWNGFSWTQVPIVDVVSSQLNNI